jgi:DNA-directed RNA polymerase I, II, and III subunit RPABC2
MSYFDDNENYGDDGVSDAGGSDTHSETSDTSSDTSSEKDFEEHLKNDGDEIEDIDPDIEEDDDEEEDESEEEDDQTGGAYPGVDFGSDDENIEEKNSEDEEKPVSKKVKKIPTRTKKIVEIDDDDDDDDPTGEIYLKKFDKEINDNYLASVHPESVSLNYDEILAMTKIVRDNNGIIIDDLHKTIPYLTKYEKARILGQRAKQINSGATAFIKVPEKVIDGYLIAELELQEKRIPFIIRRPLPNGGSEYWKVSDLENISF